MTNVKTSSLGFPRIGLNREWKKSLEAYWKGNTDRETFLKEMDEQFLAALQTQLDQQIDIIPVSDFTLYDHVLDTAVMFNWIPKRFKDVHDPLDTYFAMARGTKDAVSCEMTKWFNTNYHYIVPEFEKGAQYRVTRNKPLEDYKRAKAALGTETKPVILGLYTFVALAKGYEQQDIKDIYSQMTPLYIQVLKELEQEGGKWVQIDEPALVTASHEEAAAVKEIYQTITEEVPGVNILLQTYFDSVDAYEELISFPVAGIGLDFVHDKGKNFEHLKAHGFPKGKVLAAGILDGRNIWKANLEERLDLTLELIQSAGVDEVWIQPSNSLLHVPVAKHPDEQLADDLLNGLSFAKEKLLELTLLKNGLVSGKAAIQTEIDEAHGHLQALKQYGAATNSAFAEEIDKLTEEDFKRSTAFEERLRIQNESLGLPLLPTTTIGSFPQTAEVRSARQKWRKKEWSDEQYEAFIQEETKKWIDIQEDLGLDVLVHGEFERTDMVEYFGEKLGGFAFTKYAWVQSYGSRCVRPPVIYGDVEFKEPMTVKETVYAQSLTSKKVKGMLTGPVTILNWSFARYDLPRKEIAFQIAQALRKEVEALEKAGIQIIQVDEPALREGLPLKERDWDEYLKWAAEAFRLSTSSVEDTTQIHTHMCYSNFEDIVDTIEDLDADVITIEHSRSHGGFLDYLEQHPYLKGLGLGVYDIHSPRVPSSDEMLTIIEDALKVCPADRFWVNPDCGLKTRQPEETIAALKHMVEAAKQARGKLAQTV
ncbi:5-methyltetrahydropteroyltriglutamate--homocysteine S-methyltransferase [Bacillus paralicheniformis]|jgi:5-methyltetrahydropteroyltriglutamate--homocysteine methyltransferase|uniref:5-methyltetrahydropteroyltriglutamate--homocysteine methyltransferase n=1 Tax=Bacillus paralicheniformis TaxID=1648923 RepID=A0A6N2GZC5_9BACI|nr:5-methyltetrahydropteroyltriglutamate--homocysteine S-methyltransferase [Bacillus paralicheniformis]KUL06054.1 5-methyltetrahydropteroyltriglutamate--homocysteine methyltransferase [Bacillus licheniformis LMG 7559]MBC8622302.1 5-methyltetrahydropteroyltriglutamate--homocysteine S-methyltransferase [Robertmurraya crescens]AGN35932.1 cobalamin-independent methionine synthase MetE [Bacillus paralicheniformis ATCC 9945a]AYQ15986.1 5-methyltetrahydropteroyltriglutamate--homocysteine S-methyltrans